MGNTIQRYLAHTIFMIFLITMVPLPGFAQQAFPEGEGRDEIFIACTQCHGLGHLTRVSLNASEWENALYDMLARGAAVDIKDLETIKNYLVTNLAVDK